MDWLDNGQWILYCSGSIGIFYVSLNFYNMSIQKIKITYCLREVLVQS